MIKLVVATVALLAIIGLGAYLRWQNGPNAEDIAYRVIGMTKDRAKLHLARRGLRYRVVKEDDTTYITNGGNVPDRVNLYVKDGKVINFELG